GKAVEVQKFARDLGVQYVVEGSVRKVGKRVRITVQLIDAETDRHIWAERYDRVLTGKVLHHRSNREDNAKAQRLLDRAIQLDPGYAHAHAWKGCVLGQ